MVICIPPAPRRDAFPIWHAHWAYAYPHARRRYVADAKDAKPELVSDLVLANVKVCARMEICICACGRVHI